MVKVQSSRFNVGNFVIGVDGGGTKTAAAVAGMNGKIIARAVSGGSSVRNFGIKLAAENVAKAIYDLMKRRKNAKIVSTFIGLPAMEEEYKDKKSAIIRELKKHKKIAQIFKGKVAIGSDQLVTFRAGSYAKDGVVAICGTGTAIHGWNGKKEFLADNQGWVSKGSAIWIGNKVMEAVAEALDGRGQKTILSDLVFKKYKFKEINDLLKFLYMDSPADLPGLAPICDHAANRKDKIAQEILIASGIEIARAVIAAAQRLDFDGQVPLVLVGGVYNSRWVADTAANEIERRYPNKFDFVFAGDPVVGAVKLAIEVVK